MQKNSKECELLDAFIDKVQADTFSGKRTDISEAAAAYKDFWLPLPREPLPAAADGPLKLIVCEDPLGAHGPEADEVVKERKRFPAQELLEVCQKRLDVFRQVTGIVAADFDGAVSAAEVTAVKYSSEHKRLAWHPEVAERDASVAYQVGAGRSRWLQAEDEVALPWGKLMQVVDELMESLEIAPGDNVAIIGLGTGAHVAFAMAYFLVEKRSLMPARLHTVCPPTVWPSQDAPPQGALVTTPIRYLTCPQSVAGPPWRLETSTFGDFKHLHFEDKASLIALVREDLSSLK